jgi:hypothetical protein
MGKLFVYLFVHYYKIQIILPPQLQLFENEKTRICFDEFIYIQVFL